MRAHLKRARDLTAAAASISLIFCSTAQAGYGDTLNMPVGVTPISKDIYELHMLIFWICVAIGVLVFGAMFISMYYHRKSRGAVAAQFHHSTKVELAWTLIPFIILVVMAIPATRVLVDMENTHDSELTVKATGYQWMWHYDYIGEEVDFFSKLATPREQIYNVAEKGENYLLEVDNVVVLPIDTKIRILTTAADVIHAWWVPELGWKRDAVPGYINDNWTLIEEPGIYRGMCTELCGKDHGFMPIVVKAVTKEEFQAWLGEQRNQQTAAQDLDQDQQPAATDVDDRPELAANGAADASSPSALNN